MDLGHVHLTHHAIRMPLAACRMQWFEGEGAHLHDVIRYYVTAGTAPELPWHIFYEIPDQTY